MSPTALVATADSKEVTSVFLSDGTSVNDNRNLCKARRAGSVFALAAGYVKLGTFNALDEIDRQYREGDSVETLATRLRTNLPGRLNPILNSANDATGRKLEKEFAGNDLLQIALFAVEDGRPALHVFSFQAVPGADSQMGITTREMRCPGDCRNGSMAFFLGVHDAIDVYLAEHPSTAVEPTIANAQLLAGLEYSSRPDVVGGPASIVRADSTGISIEQAGVCSAADIGSPFGGRPVVITDKFPATAPTLAELDRRIDAVPNITCHETAARHSQHGAQIKSDSFDADVSIAEGHEVYSAIYRNGKNYDRISAIPGAWAEGELSSMLRVTRQGIMHHRADMATRVGPGGVEEFGVTFRVMADEDAWTLTVNSQIYPVTFDGTAWFSSSTGDIAEIDWRSLNLSVPSSTGIAQIEWTTLFGDTQVSGQHFVVPVQADYRVIYQDRIGRTDWTETHFTNFRRFGALSTIDFESF